MYRDLGGDAGGEYQVLNLPALTLEPYAQLNSEEWFVDTEYVLAPDGRHLAFARWVNHAYGQRALYVMDLGAGESERIAVDYPSNGTPNWTSDGRFLEFDNGSRGFIYDVQTGSLREIATRSGVFGSSAISPTGDRVAYEGACPFGIACPVDLYLVNSDGTGETFLEQGDIDWIFWGADGRRFYYSLFGDRETYGNSGEATDSGYRLHVFDLETGQSSLLEDWMFNTEAWDSSFLSPDGAFLAYLFGSTYLKVRRTSDDGQIALLPTGKPAWSPDSRYLAVGGGWGAEWYLFDGQTGESIPLDVDLETSTIVGWLP